MNYLAHAWLSFYKPGILTGNIISDFVKGKKRFDFDEEIQKGIMLHRLIDAFTDEHPDTKRAKQYFKPEVGLYAGAFVDVAYDHFLALDKNEFTDESLANFSYHTYEILDEHASVFPEKFARIFIYMKQDNWLYNYKTLYGIEQSFKGLIHRAKYLQNNVAAFDCFSNNYTALQDCYSSFFPEVKSFAYAHLGSL